MFPFPIEALANLAVASVKSTKAKDSLVAAAAGSMLEELVLVLLVLVLLVLVLFVS